MTITFPWHFRDYPSFNALFYLFLLRRLYTLLVGFVSLLQKRLYSGESSSSLIHLHLPFPGHSPSQSRGCLNPESRFQDEMCGHRNASCRTALIERRTAARSKIPKKETVPLRWSRRTFVSLREKDQLPLGQRQGSFAFCGRDFNFLFCCRWFLLFFFLPTHLRGNLFTYYSHANRKVFKKWSIAAHIQNHEDIGDCHHCVRFGDQMNPGKLRML